MAELLERLAIVLIPLVAVLIPLSRYVVPAYNWFNGRRIWRWHRALADLERDAAGGDIAARRSEIRARLAEAESASIRSAFQRRWKASFITCATGCARYVSISKARNVTSASRREYRLDDACNALRSE